MTEEEKNTIVNETYDKVVEYLLLNLPKILGNIIQEKISMKRLADEFFGENKQFLNHLDIVSSVISSIESNNPGKQYKEVLVKAAPEIKKRIASLENISLKTVNKPDNQALKFKSDNGII